MLLSVVVVRPVEVATHFGWPLQFISSRSLLLTNEQCNLESLVCASCVLRSAAPFICSMPSATPGGQNSWPRSLAYVRANLLWISSTPRHVVLKFPRPTIRVLEKYIALGIPR